MIFKRAFNLMKNFPFASTCLASAFLLLLADNSLAQDKKVYQAEIMKGLSGSGKNAHKPYITPGDKSYIVGTQDGDFPDMGSHVEGEMGGLWMAPIKLMDGFWLNVTDLVDSSSVLLKDAREFINYPYGNKFVYAPILNGIHTERLQFCPQGAQGMVVKYTFKNASGALRKVKLNFLAKTDISPVWFSKENNIIDAVDSVFWDATRSVFIGKDSKNPWFAVWGSSIPAVNHTLSLSAPVQTAGMGTTAATEHHLEIKPHESATVVFAIAGSNKDAASALATYEEIIQDHLKLLSIKQAHYESIIRRSYIEIPDKKLQQVYNWGKINTDWLISDIPEIGRFLGAGAIEYPWLFGCDNAYALQGVVASGDHELAKSTLRTLKNVSEKANGNGRIIHEMSSNGFVGNPGNTQETAQYALAVWKVFQWTGDKEFLREVYPYIKRGINWLLTEKDSNGNMFPEGYGIMEVKGLNAELIDVAVYTQQALDVTSKMARVLGEPDMQKVYAQKAVVLKNKINGLFWDENEGSYCDFYGTREQAMATTKGAIEQIQVDMQAGARTTDLQEKQEFYRGLLKHLETFPEGTKKGWFTNKNWVISTPMETGIAPRDKAIRLLDKVRKEHTGEYGPFLSGVEKTNMMTIATGVQAMAEAAYGRTDESMWYVDKIVRTFGKALPGSISEMMPDYGCPVQAWTIYGIVTPLITHVFGLQPEASEKAVSFSPNLPAGWDSIKISDLPVGDNIVSFSVKKGSKSCEYEFNCTIGDWQYTLKRKGLAGKRYILNGKKYTASSDEIRFKGKSANIIILN